MRGGGGEETWDLILLADSSWRKRAAVGQIPKGHTLMEVMVAR